MSFILFCRLVYFFPSSADALPHPLAGILPADGRAGGVAAQTGEEDMITIARCGRDFAAAAPREEIPYGSSVVPLLDRSRNRLR